MRTWAAKAAKAAGKQELNALADILGVVPTYLS